MAVCLRSPIARNRAVPASWAALVLAVSLLGAPAGRADDWPQFRGPQRDNISRETGLAREFPPGGPKPLWTTDVCEGYGGAAIVAGKVYFEDYSKEKKEYYVRCLELASGKELWRFTESKAPAGIRANHGITRAVPAVDGVHVFALDPKCVLHCLEAATGKELWQKSLVKDYAAQIPAWYNGQCPLLDGDRVVIGVGGAEALMVAFDRNSGKELWRTPNESKWLLSHASVMPATLGGVKQYLWCTLAGPLGVKADDGQLLWFHERKFNVAVAPSPLPIGDDRVLMTSGYDAGTVMVRVQPAAGGKFKAEPVFDITTEEWNAEVHAPIYWQDHLYAVGKKKRGLFECLDQTCKPVWSSEGKAFFGLGSFLLADGMFFILEGDTGLLRLLDANTKEYKELASAPVLSGHDVWAPMALSDGKLVLRDMAKMICIDVRKVAAGAQAPIMDRRRDSGIAARRQTPAAPTFRTVALVADQTPAPGAAPASAPATRGTPPVKLVRKQVLSLKGDKLLHDELRGLWIDAHDRLYAAGDRRVLVLSLAGEFVRAIDTDKPAYCVAVASDGALYIGEEGAVQIFTADGQLRTTWTDAEHLSLVTSIGFVGDEVVCGDVRGRCLRRFNAAGKHLGDIGRDARIRGFMLPNGYLDFAADPNGVLVAANPGQHRVQRFSRTGEKLGQFGRFDGTDPVGFNGCCNPTNLALLPGGDIVVTVKAPPGAKVYNAAGELLAALGAEDFDPDSKNMDIAVDRQGRIYIADSVRLQVGIYERASCAAGEP